MDTFYIEFAIKCPFCGEEIEYTEESQSPGNPETIVIKLNQHICDDMVEELQLELEYSLKKIKEYCGRCHVSKILGKL